MPGAPDPRYVLARTVLLDALEALGDQRSAVVVVGAQAVYLHTGTIDLGVPEFTLDADITLDPTLLREIPEIEAAMLDARFVRGNRVGVWIASRSVGGTPVNVEVDFTDARADGPQMAVRAAGALLPAEVVAASCAGLASDLLRAIDTGK